MSKVRKNKRLERSLTTTIRAAQLSIIKLACPVEELKWIPDWEYDLIYSESGVNETNCIFDETFSGKHFFGQPLKTTWVTVIHAPDTGRILFQLNLSGKASIRFEFNCRETEKGVTEATWQMTFTALNGEVDSIPDDALAEKMDLMMVFLSNALKHYCETGTMLT